MSFLQVIYLNRKYDVIVVWRTTRVAHYSWTLVQLTLPVGVSMIHVDAVSGPQSHAVNYVALDDVTIAPGACPQPGNSLSVLDS